MATITVKLQFNDTFRRFALTEPFTYDALWRACSDAVHQPLSLKYVDDDGDEISFHTDTELEAAIALRDDTGLLRVQGVVCPEMQEKFDAMVKSKVATSVAAPISPSPSPSPQASVEGSEPGSRVSELSLESSWYLADAQDAQEEPEVQEAEGESSQETEDEETEDEQAEEEQAEEDANDEVEEPSGEQAGEQAGDDDMSSFVQVPVSVGLTTTEPAVVSIPASLQGQQQPVQEPRISFTKAEFTTVLQSLVPELASGLFDRLAQSSPVSETAVPQQTDQETEDEEAEEMTTPTPLEIPAPKITSHNGTVVVSNLPANSELFTDPNDLPPKQPGDRDIHIFVDKATGKILRAFDEPPVSTSTPAAPAALVPPQAEFLRDNTLEDGCSVTPQDCVVKGWSMLNSGSLPWPADTHLHCLTNEPTTVDYFPINIPEAGEETTVQVALTLPATSGDYTRVFKLMSQGKVFGPKIWVKLQVEKPAPIAPVSLATPDPVPQAPAESPAQTVEAPVEAPAVLSTEVQVASIVAAEMFEDVPLPNIKVAPNASLSKTWKIKNTGNVAWGKGTRLRCPQIKASTGMQSVPTAYPEQTVDVTLTLMAPAAPGSYETCWRLETANGALLLDNLKLKIKVSKKARAEAAEPVQPKAVSQTPLIAQLPVLTNPGPVVATVNEAALAAVATTMSANASVTASAPSVDAGTPDVSEPALSRCASQADGFPLEASVVEPEDIDLAKVEWESNAGDDVVLVDHADEQEDNTPAMDVTPGAVEEPVKAAEPDPVAVAVANAALGPMVTMDNVDESETMDVAADHVSNSVASAAVASAPSVYPVSPASHAYQVHHNDYAGPAPGPYPTQTYVPPAATQQPPTSEYLVEENAIAHLVSMGFYNRDFNRRLLRKHKNNIEAVVAQLLEQDDFNGDWSGGRHTSA